MCGKTKTEQIDREREFVCAWARLHSHIEAIRVVTEKKSDIQLVLFVISDLLVA